MVVTWCPNVDGYIWVWFGWMQWWILWRFIREMGLPPKLQLPKKKCTFFHVIWVVACGGEIDSCILGRTVDLKGMSYLWVHHWWVRSKGMQYLWFESLFAPEVTKKGPIFFLTSQAVFLNYGGLGNLLAPRLCCLALAILAHRLHLAGHSPAQESQELPVAQPAWVVILAHGAISKVLFGAFMGFFAAALMGFWFLFWPCLGPSTLVVIGIRLRVLSLLQVRPSIPNWRACSWPCSLATNFFRINFRAWLSKRRLGAP